MDENTCSDYKKLTANQLQGEERKEFMKKAIESLIAIAPSPEAFAAYRDNGCDYEYTKEKQMAKANLELQNYRGIPLQLIDRKYGGRNAKRYALNGTNQNVWIPNKHLEEDGTIKKGENIDYVFRRSNRQLNLAGITQGIYGIKGPYNPKPL